MHAAYAPAPHSTVCRATTMLSQHSRTATVHVSIAGVALEGSTGARAPVDLVSRGCAFKSGRPAWRRFRALLSSCDGAMDPLRHRRKRAASSTSTIRLRATWARGARG